MITVYSDGATEGHNGKFGTVKFCGIGFYCEETGYEFSARVPAQSNNEAEFMALIEAMKWALREGFLKVQFYLDSRVVVRRAKLRCRGFIKSRPMLCNNPEKTFKLSHKAERYNAMSGFQTQVFELSLQFQEVYFDWIPRQQNHCADHLSKKSLCLT